MLSRVKELLARTEIKWKAYRFEFEFDMGKCTERHDDVFEDLAQRSTRAVIEVKDPDSGEDSPYQPQSDDSE